MVFARRSVAHDVVGNAAFGDHVRSLLHRHGYDRRHRLDTLHVQLGQLLEKGQHGTELAFEGLNLVVRDGDTGEMRYAADINRHEASPGGPTAPTINAYSRITPQRTD